MKTPQKNQKNSGRGPLTTWRWAALFAMLACLFMAGRATAGTLTVSSTVITRTNAVQPYGYGLGQSYNLSTEGDLDWAHWGTYVPADFDHKAGVTPQIGNFLSSNPLGGLSTSDANCSWVDGTVDQVMPTTRGGVFINGPGTMSFDAISSGGAEFLHVYTAPYANPQEFAAPGATMTFTLSDGTSPVTISLEPQSRRTTVAFSAAPGTTLTVSMNCPGGGRIALLAASLSSADPLALGVAQAQLGSGTALKVGSSYYVQAIAHGTDINGGSAYAYQWQVSYNGGGYADIAGATSWQLQTTAGAAGTYNYRVRVTLGANTVTSAPSATLTATAGTSALGATSAEIPAYGPPLFLTTNVDLTAEGTTDWAYWGFTGAGSYDSKGSSIGNYTQIGADGMKLVTSRTSFAWTDGTPDASSGGSTTNTAGMISTNGYELNIPVTTTPQVLNVYVSANFAYAQVEASLANGSAPVFVDKPQTTLGTVRYTFGVAANAGTTLIIKVTNIGRTAYTGNGGSVALQAATLTPVPALSVGALVASPNNSVAVNQPMVVSPGALNLQGLPPFSYVWQRDIGSGYVTQPNNGRSASFTAGSTGGTESWRVAVTSSQGSVTSAPVVITRNAGGILKRLDNSLIGITDMTQEGTIDWATWNYSAVGDYYHKATGGSQIGPYILLGPSTANERGGGTRIPMIWSDGTPVATGTNYWTARRNPGLTGGYELNVAASTTSRILSVYIVSFASPIHIEAYLDDNSGIKLVDEDIPVPDSGNSGSWKYSLQFAAANPGAHLIFRVWFLPTGGNISLLGATLYGVPTLTAGTAVVSPSSTVAVGSTINLRAQGAKGIPPLSYQWQMDSGAGYANINGATNASQLTTSGTAGIGVKNYKVVVTDSTGSVASTPVAVTVIAPTSTLTGSYSPAISLQNGGRLTNNLTTEGVLDWAHWGFANKDGYDVKSPLAGQISSNNFIGPFYDYANDFIQRGGESTIFTWTDGTPTVSAFGNQSGIARSGNGLGSELTVPASTYEKVFNVYVMPRNVGAHMEAYLSDGSAPVYMDESLKGPNYWGFRYSFRYSSPNPAAVLHVRFWQDDGYAAGFMSLYSASLAYANKLYVVPAAGGQVTVTWPAGGTLQGAPSVTGPWTPIVATSPFTFTPTGAQKYFRTQTP